MAVIIDFLTDAAKIVFGSAVVGFFIPGVAGDITRNIFLGGSIATAILLILAVTLSKQIKKI